MLQHAATRCNTLQNASTCCSARLMREITTWEWIVGQMQHTCSKPVTNCRATAAHCNTPATHRNTLQKTTHEGHCDVRLDRRADATHCNTPATHLQHTCNTPATHCNTLQQTTYQEHRDVRLDRRVDATHCNTPAAHLQHTWNTLQQTATHCNKRLMRDIATFNWIVG